MNYETRLKQAKSYYAAGLERVKTTPEPKGQKFPIGTRVMIDDDLGPTMSHFPTQYRQLGSQSVPCPSKDPSRIDARHASPETVFVFPPSN